MVTGHNIRVYICLWRVRSGLRSTRVRAAEIPSRGPHSIIPPLASVLVESSVEHLAVALRLRINAAMRRCESCS